MSKTTVVIDDILLEKAMKLCGVKTKKSAIEAGLKKLIQDKNISLLKKELGTYDLDLDKNTLERMREE